MQHRISILGMQCLFAAALTAAWTNPARADAIIDWNIKSGEIILESKMGTPPAVRVMALVQTAAFEAANAITRKYPGRLPHGGEARDAPVEAAVAAAHRITLSKLVPTQQAQVDAAYRKALAAIADGPDRAAGIVVGEEAAAAILAQRAIDGVGAADVYRPHALPGAWVPTAGALVPQWATRKPWLMRDAAQFRPEAPPALTSDTWARDFNEVRALGSRNSAQRTAEQTETARFWEFSQPSIYHGIVRSVASMPGRELTQNARLFAAIAQAMDDALIGVFEAKYHYQFWRPATAIRNGDIDGNDATAREASWAPLIDAPLHPEYPGAHCILAATVSAVLRAELGEGPTPLLRTSSPTAKNATRSWTSLNDFVQEVGNARLYGGLHYRTSNEAGMAMGRRIGELAASRHFDVAR